MTTVLTYRYKLLPTKAQHRALERILEDQRQLYNAALEERIACYRKTGKGRNYKAQTHALTECRAIIPEMSSLPVVLQRATLHRLENTYDRFYRRLKSGKAAGFPRFKSAAAFNSFGFLEFKAINLQNKRLRFKGLPGAIRVCMHRPIAGKIIGCQFTRSCRGWSVSFQAKVEACEPRPILHAVGVDIGLLSLATLSNGKKIPNPRASRKASRKMRMIQRALARCKRSSKRRIKVKQKGARLHAQIANTRRTYLHQQSAMLVKTYDLIAIEALTVQNLIRGNLARSIHDAGWGIFVNFLRYKAERAGAHLIEVDPKYTSQTCPDCGTVKAKTLAERAHDCPCGCVLDRDVAAARVILNKAVAGLEGHNVTHTWGERATMNLNAS